MWDEYSSKVIKNFKNPKNMGELKNPDGVARVGNPQCGDIMEMQIKVTGNRITDIKFRTFGCVAAIATSSMATQMVKGKTLDEALKLTDRAVAEALSGLPPVKMHCSNLAATAIRKAINDYKKKHGLPYEEVEEEHEHGQEHGESEERTKAGKKGKRKTGPKARSKGRKK